ncbi:MAG: nuclear transport factor 2 family protein [Rubricoccaceae bacterium]|nr:nuclear transport factor 2 family protein [Rubricoccaceae bacterium]
MASILEMTQDLTHLASTGRIDEAITTYYADDVTITESTGETAQGRETQRQRVQAFMAQVQEMHGGGVRAITANEDEGVSMVETWSEMTFADGNRMTMEEVERYRWEDGKIVDARFYYATDGMQG